MNKLNIREPIWKTQSIGIAERILPKDGHLEINISYHTKDGKLLYPNTYFITREKAIKFPIEYAKGHVKLHIVPIAKLEILK